MEHLSTFELKIALNLTKLAMFLLDHNMTGLSAKIYGILVRHFGA